VRAEARKTTWTSPKETWITSVMVLIMVVLATLFFFGVDAAVSWIVQQLIMIGA
jgi:preprotein translocase subunit SecE